MTQKVPQKELFKPGVGPKPGFMPKDCPGQSRGAPPPLGYPAISIEKEGQKRIRAGNRAVQIKNRQAGGFLLVDFLHTLAVSGIHRRWLNPFKEDFERFDFKDEQSDNQNAEGDDK